MVEYSHEFISSASIITKKTLKEYNDGDPQGEQTIKPWDHCEVYKKELNVIIKKTKIFQKLWNKWNKQWKLKEEKQEKRKLENREWWEVGILFLKLHVWNIWHLFHVYKFEKNKQKK